MRAERALAYPTLLDTVLPRAPVRDAVLIVGFAFITALFAQIRIQLPWTPVPITGQTFAVLLAGALLGGWRGGLSQALYVGLGIAGLPVFATRTVSLAGLLGPTGGYLVGFILAAALVGALIERGWDRRLGGALGAMVLGNLVIYLFGATWLAIVTKSGLVGTLVNGVLPFIPGDALKILAAAALLPAGWKLRARFD